MEHANKNVDLLSRRHFHGLPPQTPTETFISLKTAVKNVQFFNTFLRFCFFSVRHFSQLFSLILFKLQFILFFFTIVANMQTTNIRRNPVVRKLTNKHLH
uniref:(northern house mosquito) hypothetical protein n=1 Tax=Culex pipiens TaxID=7175 RepID=A0A8D8P9Y4_CULPI